MILGDHMANKVMHSVPRVGGGDPAPIIAVT